MTQGTLGLVVRRRDALDIDEGPERGAVLEERLGLALGAGARGLRGLVEQPFISVRTGIIRRWKVRCCRVPSRTRRQSLNISRVCSRSGTPYFAQSPSVRSARPWNERFKCAQHVCSGSSRKPYEARRSMTSVPSNPPSRRFAPSVQRPAWMRKKLTVQVQATQSQCVLCCCCQLVSSAWRTSCACTKPCSSSCGASSASPTRRSQLLTAPVEIVTPNSSPRIRCVLRLLSR